jgi:mannose-6-phosphate isomerase-like protein (cupin superfamily)
VVKQGQQISNPRTGQLMTLISADPAELRLDTLNPPTAVKEPVHVHPHQESGAELLSGALVFEVAGERREIGAGETITIPANTPQADHKSSSRRCSSRTATKEKRDGLAL